MSKVETSESERRDIEKFTKHLIYKFVQVRVLCHGYMDVKTNAYHYADHKVSKWVQRRRRRLLLHYASSAHGVTD